MLQGALIGVGAILPGVSSGALAVTMGVYDGMVSALTSLFSTFKKSFPFLLPLGIGGVIGVLLSSNALQLFFFHHETQVTMLFCGFVLGNLPWLFLEAKGEARFKKRYAGALLIGLIAIFLLGYVESLLSANAVVSELTAPKALLAGAVLSVGIIIPGISASLLLLYMGTYFAILSAIADIRLKTLLFAGIGFLAMSAILIFTVNRVIQKHHAVSYFLIIGFSTGSVILVLPRVIPGLTWICPFLFIFGLSISVFMGYLKARKLGMTADFPPELPPDAGKKTDR